MVSEGESFHADDTDWCVWSLSYWSAFSLVCLGRLEVCLAYSSSIDVTSDVDLLVTSHIVSENAEEVYLRDLLGNDPIRLEPKERKSYAKFNGQNVVMLDVKKQSGENLIEASNKINEIIDDFKETNRVPKDLQVVVTLDQSDDTRESVANLENSIISGVISLIGFPTTS